MDPRIKVALGVVLVIIAIALHYFTNYPSASFLKGFLFALGFVYIIRSFSGMKKK